MPKTKELIKQLKLPQVKTYSSLRTAVRDAIRKGKSRARKAVEREKVRTSWEIGHLILRHVLQHKDRAKYGAYVNARLSKDLLLSATQIRYMVEFARDYPIHPPAGELPWSTLTDLLSINDVKIRATIAAKADKQNWTRKRLRSELKKYKPSRSNWKKPTPLKEPKRGTLGSYRVVVAKFGPYKGKKVYDLGFSTFYKPKGSVRSRKRSSKSKAFTYTAHAMQVTDGDTFWAVVDLGFGVMTEQSLRLRGIDASELPTKAGQAAKRFLGRMLKKENKELIIQTTKSDKYDRYLADIWVGDLYLNQALVDQGHADSLS